MRNFILVVLAVVALADLTTAQQPTGDANDRVSKVIAAWDATKVSTRTLECELNVTTIEIARKSPVSNRDLYPRDITPMMTVVAFFDFSANSFAITLDGEKFDTRSQSTKPYSDKTVYKYMKLYGYLVPPPGKETGVGHGSGSIADLVVVEGSLDKQQITREIVPVLYSRGIVPLSPIHTLHPGNWNSYSLREFSDLVF